MVVAVFTTGKLFSYLKLDAKNAELMQNITELMQNTVAGVAPPAPEVDYAELPEDALCTIYALLPAFSLRAAAASNSAWCRALRGAGPATRRRASWVHHWTDASVGASIQPADTAVCTGDGSWHPGGVALAATLHLRKGQDSGFRLTVDAAAPGDLLMGITLLQPEATPPAAAALDVGISDRGAPPHPPLEMGYHYMMGRRLDAVGEIQISPPAGGGGAGSGDGGGGGRAPRSIFYGGRSRRCCFATPSAQSSGPTMDVGPDGRSPGILAKLRHLGRVPARPPAQNVVGTLCNPRDWQRFACL